MRCPVCGGALVNDWERGEVVCVQCGVESAEAAKRLLTDAV